MSNLPTTISNAGPVAAERAGLAAILAVDDVSACHLDMPLHHEGLLDGVLDPLDLKLLATDGAAEESLDHGYEIYLLYSASQSSKLFHTLFYASCGFASVCIMNRMRRRPMLHSAFAGSARPPAPPALRARGSRVAPPRARPPPFPPSQGPWVHPEISNPDYAPVPNLHAFCAPCTAVGFELWQVKSGTLFDDVYVGDSLEEANAFAKTLEAKAAAEKASLEAAEKKAADEAAAARAKADAEAKAAEAAKADAKAEDAEDDDEEDSEL